MENRPDTGKIAGSPWENQNSGKFRSIAKIYRERILAGVKGYETGDFMPSRRELAALHNTARITVDKAMELLAAEGLIVPNRNQRAIVAERVSTVPSLDDRMAALRTTGKILGKDETCEVLEARMVACPEDIAKHLMVEPGEQVLLRSRVTRKFGRPIAYSDSYYPQFAVDAAPELAETQNIEGGAREAAVYALERTQESAKEVFTARVAMDREKELLELSGKFAVVLQTLRVVMLDDNRVIEVAVKVGEGSTPVVTNRSLAA